MFWRALLAFLVLPGTLAGILPPLLAWEDPWRRGGWECGALLLAGGFFVLVWCVRDFYVMGKGTLAPWDPPKQLVVVGLYRFVRNPMYLGVLLLISGWGVWTGSPVVGGYLVVLAVGFHLRVILHEEPWLSKQFGTSWTGYATHVPRWIPRLTPWETRS